MSLIEQVIKDVQQIVSNSNEFAVSVTLTSKSNVTKNVQGLSNKIHHGTDGQGNVISAKNATVTVSEKDLTAYPVRVNGVVSMVNHRVELKYALGETETYRVKDAMPDETLGLITLLLQE